MKVDKEFIVENFICYNKKMKAVCSIICLFVLTLSACSPLNTPAPVSVTGTATLTRNTAAEAAAASPSAESTPHIISNWNWPRSTPEEQGLSSEKLAGLLETVKQEEQEIHSILVVRHGVLVLEAYAYPFNAQTRHAAYSVTKSITSALVGLAIEDGFIGDVEDSVISYLPSVNLDDPEKEKIRIENLLSMNSGVEWTEPLHSGLSDYWMIMESDNPSQYFFTPALIEEPGTVFNYNSGGSHMLSILVQQTTGFTAVDFAAQRLFYPLGISDFSWQSDFSGHSLGGSGLELTSVDMAKIGQLYLNGGKWQGEQILPADWIKKSTQVHSNPSETMGYGYQWWIRPQGDYYALGWGGQQIRVFPEEDMVVVFTAGESGDKILHDELVDTYILPAVISDEALPANPDQQARFEKALSDFSFPKIQTSSALSQLAAEVDGKEWLVTGMGEWSMFTLHFSNDTEAQLDLTMEGEPMILRVGLDGVYRVTDTEECGPIALLGFWESSNVFVLMQQNLRDADRRVTCLEFLGDTVKLHSEWFVEPYQEESEAVLF